MAIATFIFRWSIVRSFWIRSCKCMCICFVGCYILFSWRKYAYIGKKRRGKNRASVFV
jgi:predicted metal-binding protein